MRPRTDTLLSLGAAIAKAVRTIWTPVDLANAVADVMQIDPEPAKSCDWCGAEAWDLVNGRYCSRRCEAEDPLNSPPT